jgi:hypothetical protein
VRANTVEYQEETVTFPGTNVNDGSDTIIDYCVARNVTKIFIDGVLEVRDPEVFSHALLNGIGHAKAFGCGLLLARRAD